MRFLQAVWAVFSAVFGSWGYISRCADNLVARYWDRKGILLGIELVASLVLICDIFFFILVIPMWQESDLTIRTLLASNVILALWFIPFAIHAIRHSSWHFTAHDHD